MRLAALDEFIAALDQVLKLYHAIATLMDSVQGLAQHPGDEAPLADRLHAAELHFVLGWLAKYSGDAPQLAWLRTHLKEWASVFQDA